MGSLSRKFKRRNRKSKDSEMSELSPPKTDKISKTFDLSSEVGLLKEEARLSYFLGLNNREVEQLREKNKDNG